MRRLAALALGVVAVSGCGGSAEEDDLAAKDAELDAIVERIDREAPLVGLGEASPPRATRGWKTDFERRLVPLSQFRDGGPGKDGIPAIDRPRFRIAAATNYLADREPVIALTVAGETRGYPIQVLMWHEIVNDELQGVPVAVTFCPLCNTAIAFDRRVRGRTLAFGTTGKLRDSDLVMYDRQTESWWQQFGGQALVGTYAGTRLRKLAARIVSWREFRTTHPESLVLTRETGHVRDYGRNPYAGYDDVAGGPLFPVRNEGDDRLPPKERVVFVEIGGEAVAVPFSVLAERRSVRVSVAGRPLVVRWRPGVASALDAHQVAAGRAVGAASVTLDGRPVPFTEPFWFAVAAFRPDVRIVNGP